MDANRLTDATVVVSEPDGGIYNAMNKGLALASGTLVCFMNAGDRFGTPNVIAEVLASYSASPWRWALGRGVIEDASGRPIARIHRQRYRWWRQPSGIIRCATRRSTWRLSSFGVWRITEDLTVSADFEVLVKAGRAARPREFEALFARVLDGGVSDARPASTRMQAHTARVRASSLGRRIERFDEIWSGSSTPSLTQSDGHGTRCADSPGAIRCAGQRSRSLASPCPTRSRA